MTSTISNDCTERQPVCVVIKRDGKACTYKAKTGVLCGVHSGDGNSRDGRLDTVRYLVTHDADVTKIKHAAWKHM